MDQAGSVDPDGDAVVAARLKALRTAQGLTLDAVAARSGVSRAMVSRIERGESSATMGLLARLCGGLGTTLSALLGGGSAGAAAALARRADQPLWRDPGSGYLRRAVSPAGTGSCVEIVEIELPVGAAVLHDATGRAAGDRHVWVLGGRLETVRGGEARTLETGDCLRAPIDGPLAFRSLGPGLARCAVIIGRADDGERA